MLFLRHVRSSQNDEPVSVLDSNRMDPDITLNGVYQGEQDDLFLAKYDIGLIGCSTALRARKTSDLATGSQPVLPHQLLSDSFGELDWGEWSGRSVLEVFTPAVNAKAMEEGIHFRPPGGQTIAEKASMMYDQLDRPYSRDINLVVGHGIGISSLIGVTMGWDRQQILDFKIRNGEIIEFDPFSPTEPVRLFRPTTSPIPLDTARNCLV